MDNIQNKYQVSIGIPVVKTKFLKNAIESCIFQSYTNIEIIILNNAYSLELQDEIEEILKGYSDERIRYYRNDVQLPMIQNWNRVFSFAKGEFFSLLCDDDKWDFTFIEKMIVLSDKYPNTNLFHSRVLILENDNINNSQISPLCNEYEDCLDFIYHRLKGFRLQYLSDFMVRTSKLYDLGGFTYLPDGWGSDDITWFKLAKNGGVAYCQEVLFTYNNNDINTSNSKEFKNKFESIDLYMDYTTVEKIKMNLIQRELVFNNERAYFKLLSDKLKTNKFIPNFVVPILILILKLFKSTTK